MAQEAESSKVVCLAKGILAPAVFVVDGEEFGRYDIATVLGYVRNPETSNMGF